MGGAGGLIASTRAVEIGRDGAAHAGMVAAGFDPQVADLLARLLAGFTERDRGLVVERLEEAKRLVGRLQPSAVDLLFGGSVAKRTYVEGVSDVDCLLLFESHVADDPPSDLVRKVADALSDLPCLVRVGGMAVTLSYPEGAEVQLLPAVRSRDDRLLVGGSGGVRWLDIGPEDFPLSLRRLDRRCGYKLVPVIKLAKAAMITIPQDLRPSGHHVESLAFDTFRNYDGPMITTRMLPHLFKSAAAAVLRPIRDASGQTALIDASLGAANGPLRRRLSREIDRLRRSMAIASRDGSTTAWLEVFGDPA